MTSNSDSIDVSLSNIYRSWYAFRAGKHTSRSIITFEYQLEDNLDQLARDLQINSYHHGNYVHLVVNDSKRRSIAVATVRDRVVHRLLYDYFVPRTDPYFDFDVWSCRRGKGLQAAIERTQTLLSRYPDAWVWRADITKFFDSVNHEVLKATIRRFIPDKTSLTILDEVIKSYQVTPRTGIAIGNLTSQILSNVYLNEFDRFVRHSIKPLGYLRYGDDFVLLMPSEMLAQKARKEGEKFLSSQLKLRVNPKNDIIVPAKRGLLFLGAVLYSTGARIQDRTWSRVQSRLNQQTHASYYGLVQTAGSKYQKKEFWWTIF